MSNKKCEICNMKLNKSHKYNHGDIGDLCDECFGRKDLFIIAKLISRIEKLEQKVSKK